MASLAPAVLGFAIATTGGWGWWLLTGLTITLAFVIRVVSMREHNATSQDSVEAVTK